MLPKSSVPGLIPTLNNTGWMTETLDDYSLAFTEYAGTQQAECLDIGCAYGVATLPAFVFVRGDGSVQAAAEGWNPSEWRAVAKAIADNTSWIAPNIPVAGDPSPFHGTPALG